MLTRQDIWASEAEDRDRTLTFREGFSDVDPMEQVGWIAGCIAHDLRLPLTSILAYTELMATGNLDEGQRTAFFQEVRSNVGRMTDMISMLVELSRGGNTLRAERSDIGQCVEQATRVVRDRSEFSRVRITHHHQGTGRLVRCEAP